MSQGKYSPVLPKGKEFKFNCYGKEPAPWNAELANAGVVYDQKAMFDNYDDEGFDSYGYSTFDANKQYSFLSGVDRLGNTEMDYLCMSLEDFEAV